MQTDVSVLPSWLTSLPRADEVFHISSPRRYAHEESGYDEQYNSDAGSLVVGRGVVAVLREHSAPFDGPALEIGCGTGQVSQGLACDGAYPLTIISDPSPAFLRITRNKLQAHGISDERVAYAVLVGEEIDRLPEDEFSLIVMRSALHHVLDVEAFIAAAARALRPGGMLAFQEPCMEGFLLMGVMAQFLPALAKAEGMPLRPEQISQVEMFSETMAYYARRDLDKTAAEDKHLFRVDEVMKIGERCGLTVDFLPNMTYEMFSLQPKYRTAEDFTSFFRGYAKYCMGWGDELMLLFDRLMSYHCRLVERASRGWSGPYMHGVFVCQKGQ
jgi:ubiquinone/menaquinone biosynthesis C-methylase UbiE